MANTHEKWKQIVKWKQIADHAIKQAGRVRCTFDEYIAGLSVIIDEIAAHRAHADEEMSKVCSPKTEHHE